MTTNRKPNRLIFEKSPYLLQHATNPVDWYPWGEAAFNKAKREGKPIFLSIGYSTCHWCHVMAHESFEDDEVAALLNKHYVAIKVDREERPDVDAVYMKVCQMMEGHGGWPLTIFMTPDQVPFYAGTYFPKQSKYGRPGLVEALQQLNLKYTNDPKHITEVTNSVKQALAKTVSSKSKQRLNNDFIHQAFHQLGRIFDFNYGGFGSAPKFPMPQNSLFLLRHYYFTDKTAALKMVELTLQSMASGGIYDQIGFGFSRYSTDEKWLVPHFEKMLYDNALLLNVFTEAYQLTDHPLYKKIGEEIITFIRREMNSREAAFYSAIDADSEGEEGKYYVWEEEEIFDILGNSVGEIFSEVYDITPYGNFEGKNIPNSINVSLRKILGDKNLLQQLETAKEQLLKEREKRVYPHVDDKILTAWNSMMIAALAKSGKVFQSENYTMMAEKAMNFIEKNLIKQNRLKARYRDGETKYNAYLDDYAHMIIAYLELYETTFSLYYLSQARKFSEQMIDLFWDEQDGGFFFSGKDSEELISRDKEIYDGAIPSGNSVAAVALVRMGSLTGEMYFLDKVETMYYTFYDDINRQASAAPYFMQSLQLTENATKEVVVIGNKNDPARIKLLNILQTTFLPNVSVLVTERSEDLITIAPFAAEYRQVEDKTTVYVCENFSCQQPTTDIDKAIEKIIEK
ncbi:thioredoxin domain-containing protein [Virgibacillus halodenitrificans]|uniref:thioredoxin domain-containing protein n=1 Tax=Virgibacillus halodenitrificans TaxID=1482 RepID=UPI000EF479BD|nr:thioredoxin domain-containing protein [Virgibacillus halodenitrificans]